MLGGEPDQELARDAVAVAVLGGAVVAHVATADAGRPALHRDQSSEIVTGPSTVTNENGGRSSSTVMVAQPAPLQRAALHRVGAGGEHDRPVVVDDVPERRRVRAPVATRGRQDAGPGRIGREERAHLVAVMRR